jgi:hypothetical protein
VTAALLAPGETAAPATLAVPACPSWCTRVAGHSMDPDAHGIVVRLHRSRSLRLAPDLAVEVIDCDETHPDGTVRSDGPQAVLYRP